MTKLDRAHRPAAVLVVALAVAGCAMPSVPISRPSPAAPPAAEPAPELREIAVDGLIVDDAPLGADPLYAVPSPLIRGELVWVLETAEVDGRDHVLVVADRDVLEAETPFGWIPAEADGEPTLITSGIACPGMPLRVADVLALGRFGGLACFGADPIELVGVAPMGCGIGGSPRHGEPEWLNGTFGGVLVGDAPPQEAAEVPAITIRVSPASAFGANCGAPARYRFGAHFDDPASAACRTTEARDAGTVTLDERLSVLFCRTRLVITDVQRLAEG